MDKIPIYMLDAEAKQFVAFQRHYAVFSAMLDAGALDIGWGKVTLNFAGGTLQSIVKEEVAWKRL